MLNKEQFRALAPSKPIQRLYIKLKPDHEELEVREYLSELTEGSFVYSFLDGRKLADIYTRDHLALSLFFYGFMTVIVGIGILNVGTTITANMEVRRREIATLRAVGMTLGGIRPWYARSTSSTVFMLRLSALCSEAEYGISLCVR